jgi:predicted solute-binding protein
MSFTIALPSHPLFASLRVHAERICKERGIRILQGSEHDCGEWLGRHTAELALVTPMVYARLALKTDLRIVPAPALMLEGLTYSASIYLKPNAEEIQSCVARNPDDFLMRMGLAMLSEKFDLPLQLERTSASTIREALESADAVIEYGFDAEQDVVLDVSDEWMDYLEAPMPLAFWVCRPEEVPEDISDLIHSFSDAEHLQEQEVFEQEQHGTNAGRSGKITMLWNDDVEGVIERTIELLFYLQYVPAIAATKIWQRDIVERM